MKRNILLAIALISLVIISCSRNEEDHPGLQTSPTLRLDSLRIVSYNTFKIYGTVKIPSWIKDATYGIVYTYDSVPTVETSTVVSLGTINDSVHIAEVLDNLQPGKNYYFRVFAKSAGAVWYSVEKQSSTHKLKIENVYTSKAPRNTLAWISVNMEFPEGKPADLEVFLGEYKSVITEASSNNIFFTVPDNIPAGDYKVKVKRGNYTAESITLIHVLEGTWRDLSAPPFAPRSRSAYFVLNNKGYIVGGISSPQIVGGTNEVWEYDLSTGNWVEKRPFPTSILWNAMAFTVNNKAYVLGGASGITDGGNYTFNLYAWEYDQASDTWNRKSSHPDFKSVRRQATGVVHNNKIYFGTGTGSTDALYNDLIEYDPVTDKWRDLGQLPDMGRKGSAAFSADGKLYLVGGDVFSVVLDDLWEYDFANGTWARVPGKPAYMERTGAAVSAVGNTVYLYGGAYRVLMGNGYGFVNRNDCWKFDIVTKTWTEVAYYTGQSMPLCQPVVFPTSRGFILYGGSSGDLWESSPAFTEFTVD